MRDFINIGSSPAEEDCAQVGSANYYERSHDECNRYIKLIREVCGPEPTGAVLKVKGFEHDFGTYYEVVCWFDDEYPKAVDYAFHVEGNSPEYWRGEPGSRLFKGGN